jgi:hypothetical protein
MQAAPIADTVQRHSQRKGQRSRQAAFVGTAQCACFAIFDAAPMLA